MEKGKNENKMKKFFNFIGSPRMLASLAAPMAIWFGAAVYGMGLTPSDAVGAISFRIFYTLLLIVTAVWVFHSFQSRSFASGLIGLGLILILLQGILLYGFRFTGKAGIGEGESFSRCDLVESGPWAKPVMISLALKEAQPGSDACTVILDGQEKEFVKGRTVQWRGFNLKVTAVSAAPLFVLSNARGMELEGGYFKLAFDGPESNYFQFRIVPHRFYVSLPGREGKRWKREEGRWRQVEVREDRDAGNIPEKVEAIHLKIVRGKLTLLAQDVKQGESVAFDGHTVKFEQGAAWIELEVRKRQHLYPLYAGLAMMIVGAFAKVWRNRRTA